MSISHLPEVKTLNAALEIMPTYPNGRRIFSDVFCKDMIAFHYTSGCSIEALHKEFKITSEILRSWKRKFGQDQTAYTFGKNVRFDVRTKYLAVKEMIESTIPVAHIAVKYRTTIVSLAKWKEQYGYRYQELIDVLPDGVPYLVKEEKQVFGKSNIDEVRKLLASQSDALALILNTMHLSGVDKKLVTSMKSKVDATASDIAKAEKTFRDAGIIL